MKFSEMFGHAIDGLKGQRFTLAAAIAEHGPKGNQLRELADLQQAIAALEAVKNEHKGLD
jgi:hypothetical protein